MTIRSCMSSIMGVIAKMSLITGQVVPDQSLLSALEIEKKMNFSGLFGIYLHCLKQNKKKKKNSVSGRV